MISSGILALLAPMAVSSVFASQLELFTDLLSQPCEPGLGVLRMIRQEMGDVGAQGGEEGDLVHVLAAQNARQWR